jgi:rhodanese-related sulfurtransferase
VDLPFDPRILVIDVRRETEFADGHIRGALNIPVSELTDPGTMANIEDTHNVYVHCAGGYRSIIASSMLKRQGIHNLRNITGGWKSISEQPTIEIVKENSVLN